MLLSLFLPLLALAASEPITAIQKIANGRQLLVQIAKPDAGKPTFLFLPGVNRSLLLNEPAAQELRRSGAGVVAFNFSMQPMSLATLPAGLKGAFYDKDTTLESLAEETASVARALERDYGIRNAIPVSLSYTGAVSIYLKGFPLVIDSVPLTSMAAFSPELAMYRNWLKAGELMNPFFGPAITRNALDQAYRTQWGPQVTAISKQFQLPVARHGEMVDGYVHLSRATEGFEWKNRGDRTRRVFVIAGREAPALQRSQIEIVRERLSGGSNESVYIVQESGHIVPAEQPAVYAKILLAVAEGRNDAGITVVTPSKDEWKKLGAKDSIELLDRALKSLPNSPSGTRSTAPGGGSFPGTL